MTVIIVTNSADQGNGTLRQAVLDAQSGDTIKFDSSLSNETITLTSGLWLNKSLTFDGIDAPNLTISGGNESNIFWMGGVDANLELNVRNLTLADSYYDAEAGGAIYAQENSTINVDNVDFIGNVSDGGAIHAQQGSYITVDNSNFINNDGASISDKEYATGAISLFAFGELRITNSHFEGNKGFNGGAIHVTSSDLFVENSTFVDNDSTPGKDRINYIPGAGGAIYADAATVPRDEKFYGLLPEHELEGEQEGGVISVNNSHFEGNRASGQGGAMALWGYSQDQVIVTNNTVIDNEVILNKDNMAEGGGIWLMGYGTVENNTITNNRSEDKGGGLFIWGEVPTTVSNTTFSNNQAALGGAIYSDIWDTQLNINSSNFDSNSASVEGAVLYTNGIRPVFVQDSQISNNTAADLVNVNEQSDISGFTYGDSVSNVEVEVPVEEAPVEEAPAPEVSYEAEAPVEEALEDAPVLEAPVEEAPAPEVSYEAEASVEEAPVEEVPAPEVSYEAEASVEALEEVVSQASGEASYEASNFNPVFGAAVLELNSDTQPSDKPNYAVTDNAIMSVWKTDNTWNIEVTGDADGSHFRGKIVGNQQIQNLTQYGFEASDSVWYTDASGNSLEFSMIAGDNSTDGISFNMPYEGDAKLYLEMEGGENVTLDLGSSFINDYIAALEVTAPAPAPVYEAPVEQSYEASNLMSEPISAGLELDGDSLFSGQPNYVPSEQTGLIVWNTDDVWHMEATGTTATLLSNYQGRIVSDQPIEDLSIYNLEESDRIEYADESHKVIDFSMNVVNQGMDGVSFKAAEGASVFLELENGNTVPVQAGMYMQEINLV